MATVSHLLPRSAAPVSIDRYTCRVASGVEAISGLEAKWPSLDLEAAAVIVGRELLAATTGTAAATARAHAAAALRSEALSTAAEWGGPMASFGWSLAAANAFANEHSPQVVMAVDGDGTLRAVAPLARSGSWGAGRLEMLGVRRLNEPADFVYTDRPALDALVEGLLRLRRPLLLGRLPAESPTIDALRRACRGRAVVAVRPQASCPFIPLDETWLNPENHLSSRRRSDYRRALRRAERHGEFRAEVLTPKAEHLERLLQIALDVEARSWKGAAGTALACDPFRGGHLRQFALWASHAGTLRIALLWIGKEPIAMQIATEEAGRWWLLKIGFDPAWSDCSPGTLLLNETLRHAVQRQLTSYEFLGTVEPWTQVWTTHEHKCVSVRIYPLGLHGAAVLAADAFEIARRRMKHAYQSWTNRFHRSALREAAAGEAAPAASENSQTPD
jgi:CelD/BcsL family acetyltransferase involved in cellulose biosynthesis